MSVPAPFQALVKLSLKHKEIKNTLSLDIKEDVLKMIEMMQEQLEVLEQICVGDDEKLISSKQRIAESRREHIKLYKIHLQHAH